MGRRREGNHVVVDEKGYIHIEVNGCRIVLPPKAETSAKAEPKGKMRQVRLGFPKAVKAGTEA